jgi:regulator of protease activity HflC (stomatin/prohibitin superfamily)
MNGLDAAEPVQATMAEDVDEVLDRPLTLAEMAVRAEGDALMAQEVAREAQRVALEARAHAARLRVDAAVQAAKAAEEAIRAAQPNYLPADHPSLDFPRSRQRRVAA